jgi:crossover junction endodeoxyribonuclease RuvC
VEVLYAQGRHLTAWSPERGIVPQPVGVGQIKKFWTGRGNVTKEDMVAETRARGFDPVDGNEAIALALLHWRVILGSSDDVALAA